MRRALLMLFAAGLAGPALADVLPPQDDRYAVQWGGMGLGEAHFTLQRLDEPGECYRYESRTEPVGLVRLFYGRPHELAEFCVVDGKARSRRMRYHNPKKPGDSFELRFDWAQGKVFGPGDQVRELPADGVDRLGMQQQIRLWLMCLTTDTPPAIADGPAPAAGEAAPPAALELSMVDDDSIRQYRFELVGREELELRGQRFAALRVERVDNPRKSVRFWVEPGSWRILRFEQRKGDDKPVKIEWLPPAR